MRLPLSCRRCLCILMEWSIPQMIIKFKDEIIKFPHEISATSISLCNTSEWIARELRIWNFDEIDEKLYKLCLWIYAVQYLSYQSHIQTARTIPLWTCLISRPTQHTTKYIGYIATASCLSNHLTNQGLLSTWRFSQWVQLGVWDGGHEGITGTNKWIVSERQNTLPLLRLRQNSRAL